jgi:DHA2 family multidrug resistance protein
VLEEGQRQLWFQSTLICQLSLVSAFGIGLLVLGQFVSRQPVIQLKILLGRSFASVFVMSLVVGAALYGILYIIPQFLTSVAGYNAEQSGDIAAISGIPSLILLAFFPLLVKLIDIRIVVAFGLALYGWSCMVDAHLGPTDAGPQFIESQLMRGAAQFFTLFFLNQAATASVAQNLVEDASGLFNAARNLGGSFGLAAIATLQDQRLTFHTARLEEGMSANSVIDQRGAKAQGLAHIYRAIQAQALVMTYSDLYFLLGVAMFLMIPVAFLLTPLPKTQGPSSP